MLRAETWQERDRALSEAYQAVAQRHNALHLTEPLTAEPRTFSSWNAPADRPGPGTGETRPFLVISGGRFAEALRSQINDPAIHALPFQIGGIDQWSDSTEVLEATRLRQRMKALYQE